MTPFQWLVIVMLGGFLANVGTEAFFALLYKQFPDEEDPEGEV